MNNPIMPLGNPLEYEIGSLESRAAARAMLEAQHLPVGQRENDLLAIYYFAHGAILNYSCLPDKDAIRGTPQFQEGREIALRINPDCETYSKERELLNAPLTWFQHASLRFELTAGRKPQKGDALSFVDYCKGSDIVLVLKLAAYREAWERQLEGFVFPFRVDSDFTFWKRVRKDKWSPQVEDAFGFWVKQDHSEEKRIGWYLMQQTIVGNDLITMDQASRNETVCFGDTRLMAPKRRGQQTV